MLAFMKSRHVFAWPALVLVLTAIGATSVERPAAFRPKQPPSACGGPLTSRELIEPPDVNAWDLPLNAGGEHELILTVHRNGPQFCYGYRWNGVLQTIQPTIRVRRGENFALRVVNDIGTPSNGEHVASSAIPKCMPMPMPYVPAMHYVGYLNHTIDDRYFQMPPLDTNIHLHGFEGPADQENIFLSTLSTPTHACEYHIAIPRTQPPGTYFYHPHSHGASRAQVAGGLSGAWIVEPSTAITAGSAEHVIVLRYAVPERDDNPFAPDLTPIFIAALAHEKAIRPAAKVAYDPFDPPPWPVSVPMNAGASWLNANGCDGNFSSSLLTINDADTPASLTIGAGQTQLFRIVNATSDSVEDLRLRDSHDRIQLLHVVARDGVSVSDDTARPLARYIAMDRVVLPPAGRVDILLSAKPGKALTLYSDHMCNGPVSEFAIKHDLLNIRAVANTGSATAQIASSPVRVDTPAARLIAFARAHSTLIRKRAITFSQYVFPKAGKVPPHPSFFITDTTNRNFHEHPFWPAYRSGGTLPSNPDITVKAGTIEEWWLINTTQESHAFHIHQMAFVDEKGPAGVPVALDVVYIPVGKMMPNKADPRYPLMQPSITKVLLDFRHVPRGTFVFHCHMLFHEDHGMMGIIQVE